VRMDIRGNLREKKARPSTSRSRAKDTGAKTKRWLCGKAALRRSLALPDSERMDPTKPGVSCDGGSWDNKPNVPPYESDHHLRCAG